MRRIARAPDDFNRLTENLHGLVSTFQTEAPGTLRRYEIVRAANLGLP